MKNSENVTWKQWKNATKCTDADDELCESCIFYNWPECPVTACGGIQSLMEWAYEQGKNSKQSCSTCGTTKQHVLKHSAGWISAEEGEFCNECVKKMISNTKRDED